MDYSEFRRHLGKAGLTVAEFASLLDVCATSVSNYAAKGSVPRAYAVVAVLLGDAADRGSEFRAALSRFGIHIRKQGRLGENVRQLAEFKRRKTGR